jgi:hypothetical protein
MFLEYISLETMLSGSKILPTTGRSTPLYHYMEIIYVAFTNFKKKSFWYTVCDTWNSPTYEYMIYFVAMLQNHTKMVVPFQG